MAANIPTLFWFVRPERQEFAVQILQGLVLLKYLYVYVVLMATSLLVSRAVWPSTLASRL